MPTRVPVPHSPSTPPCSANPCAAPLHPLHGPSCIAHARESPASPESPALPSLPALLASPAQSDRYLSERRGKAREKLRGGFACRAPAANLHDLQSSSHSSRYLKCNQYTQHSNARPSITLPLALALAYGPGRHHAVFSQRRLVEDSSRAGRNPRVAWKAQVHGG